MQSSRSFVLSLHNFHRTAELLTCYVAICTDYKLIKTFCIQNLMKLKLTEIRLYEHKASAVGRLPFGCFFSGPLVQ